MQTYDGKWRPAFGDMVACEPAFAWIPVRLWNNRVVWLQKVYRIYVYKHQHLRGGSDWSTHYSLEVPKDAL